MRLGWRGDCGFWATLVRTEAGNTFLRSQVYSKFFQPMVLLTKVNNTVVVDLILTGFGHKQVTVALAGALILSRRQEADENGQGGLGRDRK